jgi:hypothetical protein
MEKINWKMMQMKMRGSHFNGEQCTEGTQLVVKNAML